MTKQEHINFWKTSSEEDWLTANEIAAKNERKYFSLYIAHLSVEKILKALYVKIFDRTPPYKHDLYLLAEKCGIKLSDERINDLKVINEFNIQTRYPEYKQEFYKKCTPEFIKQEMKKIEELRTWIQNIIDNMP